MDPSTEVGQNLKISLLVYVLLIVGVLGWMVRQSTLAASGDGGPVVLTAHQAQAALDATSR